MRRFEITEEYKAHKLAGIEANIKLFKEGKMTKQMWQGRNVRPHEIEWKSGEEQFYIDFLINEYSYWSRVPTSEDAIKFNF